MWSFGRADRFCLENTFVPDCIIIDLIFLLLTVGSHPCVRPTYKPTFVPRAHTRVRPYDLLREIIAIVIQSGAKGF